MEGIAVEYFPNTDNLGIKEKSELHSYIGDENKKMHVIHMLTWFIYSIYLLN